MPATEWKRLYAEVMELDPPEHLAQRITAITQDSGTATPAAQSPSAARRWVGLTANGIAIAGVAAVIVLLGVLALANHSRRNSAPNTTPAGHSSSVAANGVRLTVPQGWSRIQAASDAPVIDPRTLLVVGTTGVHAQRSACQIASYHVPARGAVVVVVAWAQSKSNVSPAERSGPGTALDRLTLHQPTFECYPGPGAAAQVHLNGRDYQVNVMVGKHATPAQAAQALSVARSFTATTQPQTITTQSGMTLSYPSGWNAQELQDAVYPGSGVLLTSYPMPAGGFVEARDQLPPGESFLMVMDIQPPGSYLHDPMLSPRAGPLGFGEPSSFEGLGQGYRVAFTDSGHAVIVYAKLDASKEEAATGILNSIGFTPTGTVVSGVVRIDGGPATPNGGSGSVRREPGQHIRITGTTAHGARFVRELVADGTGSFRLNLPPGDYRVAAIGGPGGAAFPNQTEAHFRVVAGRPAHVSVTIHAY